MVYGRFPPGNYSATGHFPPGLRRFPTPNRYIFLHLLTNKENVELKYIFTRTPPLFPPSTWNVFELTKAGIGRTNNISEGWNNKFATLVRINHPNIWLFIEALQ
ncbi:Uncharacterized protein FWK35_00018157 [Aphis craccivora]|uniref:Uncharacterized protein n=1 Tax=Aphis craccivora TaxID=307492 RepID=A0A6G0YD74_APHCR|nr:Uncharacterized protein FWK35_00018157 [Aphis craccivora]